MKKKTVRSYRPSRWERLCASLVRFLDECDEFPFKSTFSVCPYPRGYCHVVLFVCGVSFETCGVMKGPACRRCIEMAIKYSDLFPSPLTGVASAEELELRLALTGGGVAK